MNDNQSRRSGMYRLRRKESLGQNIEKYQHLIGREGRVRNGGEGVVTNSSSN